MMVTHDVVEAVLLADRIAVLDKGKLIEAGSPREVAAASEVSLSARSSSFSTASL